MFFFPLLDSWPQGDRKQRHFEEKDADRHRQRVQPRGVHGQSHPHAEQGPQHPRSLLRVLSLNHIALLHWNSLVVGLRQPTGHWFSCQMAICHWSPSVARTNEDQHKSAF